MQFNHHGYLFLATPEKVAKLDELVKMQRYWHVYFMLYWNKESVRSENLWPKNGPTFVKCILKVYAKFNQSHFKKIKNQKWIIQTIYQSSSAVISDKYLGTYSMSVFFMYRYLGAEVELFSAEKLKQRFPWLNLDGIEAGSLGIRAVFKIKQHQEHYLNIIQ